MNGLCVSAHVAKYRFVATATPSPNRYRQLDYWCRIGLVTPSVHEGRGTGGPGRRWSEGDVHRVRLVGLLMHWSASNPATTRIARRMVQEVGDMPADTGYLVVGATGDISWAADGAAVAQACRENGPGCWVLDLAGLAAGTGRREAVSA